ncbi:MAG: hypothetical protein LAT82_03580 [Nanoarchaeota archaeon]|nr:hypothetical protein [Nanoarchaeota archaeon]
MNKEIEYFKVRLGLLWLENKEYKINLLMGFISNISLFITVIALYMVVGNLFLFEYGFRIVDFILLFSLLLFSSILWRLFANSRLSEMLKRGDFNKILTLPVSAFVFQAPFSMFGVGLINILTNFVILIILLVIFYYPMFYIVGFLIIFLGNIFQFTLMNCIFSFSFFMKENSFLYRLYYNSVTGSVEQFTPIAFSNSPVYMFMALLPASIYGFWAVEGFKGNFEMLNIIIVTSLVGICIFSIITYINWKIGIKRYEGFGG